MGRLALFVCIAVENACGFVCVYVCVRVKGNESGSSSNK